MFEVRDEADREVEIFELSKDAGPRVADALERIAKALEKSNRFDAAVQAYVPPKAGAPHTIAEALALRGPEDEIREAADDLHSMADDWRTQWSYLEDGPRKTALTPKIKRLRAIANMLGKSGGSNERDQ